MEFLDSSFFHTHICSFSKLCIITSKICSDFLPTPLLSHWAKSASSLSWITARARCVGPSGLPSWPHCVLQSAVSDPFRVLSRIPSLFSAQKPPGLHILVRVKLKSLLRSRPHMIWPFSRPMSIISPASLPLVHSFSATVVSLLSLKHTKWALLSPGPLHLLPCVKWSPQRLNGLTSYVCSDVPFIAHSSISTQP